MLGTLRAARVPSVLSRVEFARQKIIIPEGKHVDESWRPEFQPAAYHLLHQHDLMQARGIRKSAVSGTVQGGKTFNEVDVNTAYHIAERKESVGFGLPSMDMAKDKWQLELLPLFEASPFLRPLLPRTGAGSQRGTPSLIQFRHGPVIKFLTAGGGDEKGSAITLPVVVKTEVDRYDKPGAASRENSRADQIDNRTASFGDLAFIYEECTKTTTEGRIHNLIESGTKTELYVCCPQCSEWVLPDRDDLVGYEEAGSVLEAKQEAFWKCPRCACPWDEDDRSFMLDHMLPLHRGQRIKYHDDGQTEVIGDLPKTDRFSFQWNAFHNRFWDTKYIAAKEYQATRSNKPEEAEKESLQMRWCVAVEPEEFDPNPLSIEDVLARQRLQRDDCERPLLLGELPPPTEFVTAGIDIRQTELHFVVWAWCKLAFEEGWTAWTGHRVDFGIMDVESSKYGVRKGVLMALRGLRDGRFARGWRIYGTEERMNSRWTLVDGGWKPNYVRPFLRETTQEHGPGWMMVFGRGHSESSSAGVYRHPEKINSRVHWIGEECHVSYSEKYGTHAMLINADEYKGVLREGYRTPFGQPGALTLCQPETKEEQKAARAFGQQAQAEKTKVITVPHKPFPVTVYRNETDRLNHFNDAAYYGVGAANMLGVNMLSVQEHQQPTPPPDGDRRQGGEGDPYLISDRAA